MAYIYKKARKSSLKSVPTYEGETIENKVERIVSNNEPITDGAPEIFTDKKDGIISAYNIRTDRWEIAAEAMDAVTKSYQAKSEHKAEMKVIKNDEGEKGGEGNGGAESIQGKKGGE